MSFKVKNFLSIRYKILQLHTRSISETKPHFLRKKKSFIMMSCCETVLKNKERVSPMYAIYMQYVNLKIKRFLHAFYYYITHELHNMHNNELSSNIYLIQLIQTLIKITSSLLIITSCQ